MQATNVRIIAKNCAKLRCVVKKWDSNTTERQFLKRYTSQLQSQFLQLSMVGIVALFPLLVATCRLNVKSLAKFLEYCETRNTCCQFYVWKVGTFIVVLPTFWFASEKESHRGSFETSRCFLPEQIDAPLPVW